jgi:PAS domain S-box-containing protein
MPLTEKRPDETGDRAPESSEHLRVTLSSIGDAVISTDSLARVKFMNHVAEKLTGWTSQDASGLPLDQVFRIVNEETRGEVENPAIRCMRDGVIVGPANHTILLARDGTEFPIDDSAAPIRDLRGEIVGCVLTFRDNTARRKAEAALRESENRFRTLADSAPALIWINGTEGCEYVNREYLDYLGVHPPDVCNYDWTQFVHPDDRENYVNSYMEALQNRTEFHADFRFRRHDGEYRWFRSIGRPRLGEGGEFLGMIGVSIDITESRSSENASARLAAIVESSVDAIISKSLDGIIETWNQGAERIFGYEANEVIGKPITILIPQDRIDEEPEILERIRRGEPVEHYETVRQTKAGAFINISLTVSPIRDPDGCITGASKVARYITEQKRLEGLMQLSEVRYRRLFQTAKDGILIFDTETGRIIDANAHMTILTWLELEQMLGKELHEIGLFPGPEENREMLHDLLRDRYVRYDQIPFRNSRGELLEVDFMSNVYEEGSRTVAQCIVREVTERVELERRIRSQAEALAEEYRRKDQFLAMLSHELRNPLAPIRGALHVLKLESPGQENPIQTEAREVIERQLANLTRLISDLLEISRVTSGRIHLTRATVDLNQIVEHAVQTARPLIDQRNHELVVKLCDEQVWTNADSTRMEEVFINLLTNAAKYTDEGGRIEVICEQEGHEAIFRVSDNGMGIDPVLLRDRRLFQLFTQADKSLDRAAGGLGIGLSLVQRIVELHGGTVDAESEGLGKGTQFIVRIPTVAAPTGTPREDQPPAPKCPKQRPQVSRVLLVEDNRDAALMLAHVLRNKGLQVEFAHDGPDGLRRAREWKPEVVFLDIGLPGLDGYEVARYLRGDPETAAIHLIAMTGYGLEKDIQLARDAGFDAHIVKPFDLAELDQLLSETA